MPEITSRDTSDSKSTEIALEKQDLEFLAACDQMIRDSALRAQVVQQTLAAAQQQYLRTVILKAGLPEGQYDRVGDTLVFRKAGNGKEE